MNNLEEYIRLNREAFDEQELPEGHLVRFEDRLAGQMAGRKDSETGRKGRIYRPFKWLRFATVAVAAAVVAVVILMPGQAWHDGNVARHDGNVAGHKDWFAGVGDDQLEICQAYYGKMAEFYETILNGDFDGTRLSELEAIAGEGIPLVDQLPEEIDPETRAAVLKEYYGALLDGMDRLNRIYL